MIIKPEKTRSISIKQIGIKMISLYILPQEEKQKEQQMIYYRYFEGKTQQEIAKIFHISQVQVSRIQKKILKKLRRQMIGNI